MIVNPFLMGVFATLSIEAFLIILVAIGMSLNKNKEE